MSHESYITFNVSNYRCAIPVEDIIQITDVVAFQPVSGLAHPVLGVCRYREEFLFGLDMAEALGEPQHIYAATAAMLLVRREAHLFGVLCDSIGTVILGEAKEPHSTEAARTHYCITGLFQHEDDIVYLIDPWMALTQEHRALLRRFNALHTSHSTDWIGNAA